MATQEEVEAVFGPSSDSETDSDSEDDWEKYDLDSCKTDQLSNYTKQTLQKPSLVTHYTFTEDQKTFILGYYKEKRKAKVLRIQCRKKDRCKNFYYYDKSEELLAKENVIGTWNEDFMEIKMVAMGQTKGSRHCTKAVSYMLKVLLLESAKEKQYPSKGKVYIDSDNPCRAFNCYSHAFINNGFKPDPDEVKQFRKAVTEVETNRTIGRFRFTFQNFTSVQQFAWRKRLAIDEAVTGKQTRRLKLPARSVARRKQAPRKQAPPSMEEIDDSASDSDSDYRPEKKRKRELLHKELLNLQRIKELKF
jgi:hypothetical protein